MAVVITLAQQKGGSGKTTVTAHLATELAARGHRVALLDVDPQGSLGRWFMTRFEREDGLKGDITFSTSSAWGVTFECSKHDKDYDFILIDTPPKIDSDLKPALKVADLVVVPVSASEVDLWATEGVLDLAVREGKRPLVVLNRARPGTKLSQRILASFDGLEADPAQTVLGQRVAYAESLGAGQGACEFRGGTKAAEEVSALTDEVLKRLKS